MKIITWNIRGLGSKIKIRAVRKVIGREGPGIVLLQETKKQEFCKNLIRSLWSRGQIESVWVPAEGTAGGLSILWDTAFFHCEEKITTQRLIFLKGVLVKSNQRCIIGNIYASNCMLGRRQHWEELLNQMERWTDPWILGGDFNVVLSPDERKGGEGNVVAMNEFRNFVEEAQLADLPVAGGKFTWTNKRAEAISSRLDRFLVAGAVLENFPNLIQKMLPRMVSDHNPVVLTLDSEDWGPKPFRLDRKSVV